MIEIYTKYANRFSRGVMLTLQKKEPQNTLDRSAVLSISRGLLIIYAENSEEWLVQLRFM